MHSFLLLYLVLRLSGHLFVFSRQQRDPLYGSIVLSVRDALFLRLNLIFLKSLYLVLVEYLTEGDIFDVGDGQYFSGSIQAKKISLIDS